MYHPTIKKKRSTKDDLKDAAMHLLARGGPRAASVRSIAKRVGVTEAALYRHYKNKDELYFEAAAAVVQRMIDEKKALLAEQASAVHKLGEWVRLTYAFFDENPDAFTVVLLRDDRPKPKLDAVDGRQSSMFEDLVREGQASGELREIDPHVASALFSGVMLNVPRLIIAKVLPGTASSYTPIVTDAVLRILGSGPKNNGSKHGS